MSHKCFNGLSSCVGHGGSNSQSGTMFPVVEIYSVRMLDGNEVMLTSEESAELHKALEINLPVVLRFTNVDDIKSLNVLCDVAYAPDSLGILLVSSGFVTIMCALAEDDSELYKIQVSLID